MDSLFRSHCNESSLFSIKFDAGIVNFKFKEFDAAVEDLSACVNLEKDNKSAYTYLVGLIIFLSKSWLILVIVVGILIFYMEGIFILSLRKIDFTGFSIIFNW